MSKHNIYYGRRTSRLSHEEYVNRLNELYNNNIVPLDTYSNQRTKINHLCVKHNCKFSVLPLTTMQGKIVCPECKKETFYHTRNLSNLDKEIVKIRKKYGNEYEYVSGEYKNRKSKLTFMHYPKGGKPHEEVSTSYNIRMDKQCPVCCNQQICKGYNDIATTDPEIASWMVNEKDRYVNARTSNRYVDFKCPTCGFIMNKSINQIAGTRSLACPICSDDISYPNKFITNLLAQLKKLKEIDDFSTEFAPDWCRYTINDKSKTGRYDSVFCKNGVSYIVEMDGSLGHGENTLSLSASETIQIDRAKDKAAFENNYIMIRIDCKYKKQSERFEHIKKSILSSALFDIVDLSKIDFDIIKVKCEKSVFFECCNLWNEGKSAQEIIEKTHINKTKVSEYLKKGQSLGLCKDYSAHNSCIRSIGKAVVCLNTLKIYDSIINAANEYNIDSSGIIDCCKHKAYSAGTDKRTGKKMYWLYASEYNAMTRQEIYEYLQKKKNANPSGRKVILLNNKHIFTSMTLASKEYNISDSSIRKCCNHTRKHAGFDEVLGELRWMYYEEYLASNGGARYA